MFQPVHEDNDNDNDNDNDTSNGAVFDIASALGIQVPDGITAEQFNAILWQQHIANTGRKKLTNINTIEQIVELIEKSSNILVLTGAGISVSAGIPDFRSENGLYKQLKDRFNLTEPTLMFDLKYFINEPKLFSSFGGEICPGFGDKIKYYPTPSHYFIKTLESKGKLLRNYTQNIDTLEIRADINKFIACHGSYQYASCVNCQFQVNGIEIESHIFEQRVPLCPYCHPNKSDLKHLICSNNANNNLKKHKPIIVEKGNILQIRLHKILCSINYLCKGCPILFSYDESVLQKAIFEVERLMDEKEQNGEEINGNYRILVLRSTDCQILKICKEAIMQWLINDIKSFGVLKPDITFFHEELSSNYHNTLEQDLKKCDLLLVMGTSLKVAPVSSIPKRIPDNIPAVLINRERVGYPNEFDVNLLGNCDDICSTLIGKLKWNFIGANKEQKKKTNEKNKTQTMNAIDTIKVDAKIANYKHYEPNYYVFANGKLPDDVAVNMPSDVDAFINDESD